MSLPFMSKPSPAELLEEARRKQEEEYVVITEDVSKQMDNLRKVKVKLSAKYPDREIVTVSHLDLAHALEKGVLKRAERCTQDPGWMLDINGPSTDGNLLALSIYLPNEGPLAFMSFALLPDK